MSQVWRDTARNKGRSAMARPMAGHVLHRSRLRQMRVSDCAFDKKAGRAFPTL